MGTEKSKQHGGARLGAGRPAGKGVARYRPEYAERAYGLTLLGMNITEIAAELGVDEGTFAAWMRKHPKLRDAIRSGGIEADIEVVKALYRLAHGYEVTVQEVVLRDGEPVFVEVVKYIPPNPEAARFWLENRLRVKSDDSGHGTDPKAV